MHSRISEYLSVPHSKTPPSHIGFSIYRGIKSTFNDAYTLEASCLSGQWRCDAAMLLSLLASTFPLDSVDEDVQWIHSKPLLFTECRSHVLQLLQAVCAKVDSHWPSSHAVGSASITIVLRWGNVIPWCWKFFHDERMAYSEYLSDVTLTWLYHFDAPLFTWAKPSMHWEWLTEWVAGNGHVASSLLSHSFKLLLDDTAVDRCTDDPVVQVFHKLVGVLLVLLRGESIDPPTQTPASIVSCIQCMLVFFGRLPQSESNVPTLQSIVEALTHVNTEQRTWVFHSMLQDETHPFMSYIGTGVQPHISQFIERFTKTPCPAMHRCLTILSYATKTDDTICETIAVLELFAIMIISVPDNEASQTTVVNFIRSLISSVESNVDDAASHFSLVFRKALLPLTLIGHSGSHNPSKIVNWSMILRFLASSKDVLSVWSLSMFWYQNMQRIPSHVANYGSTSRMHF
ncbi:hypothetical protein BJ165DRAFT_501664 [Panaeolus papilionaceus]|nr:hypothetical protein BJ165DRAFT_501664 [Panaeolus papilionaceus]